MEGQKYKKQRFESSRDLLEDLAQKLQRQGDHLMLLNSSNKGKYGHSDKQVQALITSLNKRNYKLLETIIHY